MLSLPISLNILKTLLLVVASVFGVGSVIALHELGHLLMCKLFKIKVPFFSIGMGPVLFKKQLSGTEFAISALPVGGYVEIAQKDDPSDKKNENDQYFEDKPFYQKILVMAGGIIFNLIFAVAALTAILSLGVTDTPFIHQTQATPVVESIRHGFENCNLKPGDKILKVNGRSTHNSAIMLNKLVSPLTGQTATLLIERNGHPATIKTKIHEQVIGSRKMGAIGILLKKPDLGPMNVLSAAKHAIRGTYTGVLLTFDMLAGVFRNERVTDNIASPLMVIAQAAKVAEHGFKVFLALLAIISIGLAVLNLVPIPITDGGQIFTCTIEAIIRRPIPEKAKTIIHYVCWAAFLLLTIYLVIRDATKIIGWLR